MEKKEEIKEVPVDAQLRLAEIMTDVVRIIDFNDTDFKVRALRVGTQHLIALEAAKICGVEQANTADVIKQFSLNIPSMVDCITYALLNDKDRIYKDYKLKEFSDEFISVRDTVMWYMKPESMPMILFEILQMISVDVFFYTIDSIKTIKEMTLNRKMTMEEQKQLSLAQNGGK